MSILAIDTIQGATTATSVDMSGVTGLQMPAGSVIQVVNVQSSSGQISTTTGQYISTPYTNTITPKFSSSKIYVDLSFSTLIRGSSTGGGVGLSLKRGGTRLTTSVNNPHELYISGDALIGNRQHYAYLDSPSTTSATTYTIEAWPRYSGQTTEFDSRSSTWSMTLWEIAG